MLALWEYFWTGAAWVPGPPPIPPPPPPTGNPSNAGGGGKRQYERVGEHFWQVRERYLRQAMPRLEAIAKSPAVEETNLPAVEEQGKVEAVPPGGVLLQQQALRAALAAARSAANAKALREAMSRAQAIVLDISRIRQQYYARAIALLLLDVF